MLKIKILSSIAMLLITGVCHAVTVNFSGTMDQFNAGPYGGGTAFSGSFTLDETVMATGANNAFLGAVDNFMLTIGTDDFTGENGKANQFSSSSGATDFFTINLGGSFGTVSGSAGTDALTGVSVDWRGSDLFDDPTVLAHDLTIADFSYKRVVFAFETSGSVIDNASEINFGSASVVPVPAAAWLFGSGLIGLVAAARRRT
jgi:hypothetical protein